MALKRNIIIDILKGIAIIAVVLYHLAVSDFGYLGVDIFFVISGYLAAIGLSRSFNNNGFSYWKFLNKRLARLWPGLILISAVSLALGWFYMLPLHYKLNCESVLGTMTYTNNFVQYITGGDYWTSANEFKPLMHTWYIGILMQFYLIIPLIFIVCKKYTRNWGINAVYAIGILSTASLLLYASSLMTISQNFYLLPARFFELGSGCILAIATIESAENNRRIRSFCIAALSLFCLVLIFGNIIDVIKLRLIVIVGLTLTLVWASNHFEVKASLRKWLYPLAFLGTASYSLYLSHQVFFAFYRYIVNNIFSTSTYLWILALTITIGIALYFLFEKPISKYLAQGKKNMYIVNGICVIFVIILSAISLYYYRQDGLVRDIPELDLYVGKHCQTPEEYNNSPYSLNKDFEDNGKKNILVIGDSFGRDWVNILQEAGVDSIMDISYTMNVDENTKSRIKMADYVFVATNRAYFSSYNYEIIYPELFNRTIYRVGMKNFGTEFIGNTFSQRNKPDYFNSTSHDTPSIQEIIIYEKRLFRNNYIDMMTPILNTDGSIKLFTPDNKLISQDGLHLTKAGAQYYAEKLNVWQYLQ